MTASARIAEALRAEGGVLRTRDHPDLRRSLERRVQQGVLRTLLPGVVVPASADGPDLWIRASACRRPDAVITGRAAARWTFWPELAVPLVTLSLNRKIVAPPGCSVCEEQLPPELVMPVRGVNVTIPALTALDLVATMGGAGIDRALLSRACMLAEMHDALRLTPHRRGNADRRRLLHDSRDEPWSEAERRCHHILRSARITGWQSNLAVPCGAQLYFVDVGFKRQRVAIEVDGYEVHSRPAQFHRDRRKWSDLTAAGWRVVHVSAGQLSEEEAWFVDVVRRTLTQNDGSQRGRAA